MQKQHYVLKRECISAELNNVFNHPLTVVVAAMGYGKTTAARGYLDEVEAKCVWLSVESDELSPHFIWDSLTRQLMKIQPELGKQLNAIGFPVNVPQLYRILRMIEDYTYMTNTVLVIDDYHFAHSPELDRLIERIIRLNIKGFHVLILSRTTPNINMDELMLKGYCYLIKNHLFELSKDDIKEYFGLFGYSISENIARQVYDISEGWISAVYLLMKRYGEIGRLEPGRSIERLIETAVMARYTVREANMLRSLCILDNFTPQQAIYVTGDSAAEASIERISNNNSFIRYDEQSGVYKIHNIFSSYLRKTLEQQCSDEEYTNLYKRSGEWYVKNGSIVIGLRYFLKAGEYDLILAEFEKSSITKIIDNNPSFILELFKNIPMEAKYRHPIGYINYASFYVTNVDIEDGERLLLEIEQYYQDDATTLPTMKRRILGEIELIRSYCSFNDIRQMHQKQLKAYELLDGGSMIATKDKIVTYGSPHILYMYYREKGKMLWVVEYLERKFRYYGEVANGCGAGFEDQARAEYYLETGDLDEAELCSIKAKYKAATFEQVAVRICSTFNLARAYFAQGKFAEAAKIMDNLGAEVEVYNSPILSSAFDLCAGYLGGILGEHKMFAEWLISGDIEHSEVLYQGTGFNYIVYAKSVLLTSNYIKLEVLCEEMQQFFSRFNNLLGFLHMYILDSIAKYNVYGIEQAKEAIKPALDIGRADNIVMPFAEYGTYILEILQELQRYDDEYLNKLIVYTSQYCANIRRIKDNKPSVALLTNREKEILQLVIKGKTNRMIAAELFIAEVTVRKNLTSIYRKMDVTGRASAVRKAMEQRIV